MLGPSAGTCTDLRSQPHPTHSHTPPTLSLSHTPHTLRFLLVEFFLRCNRCTRTSRCQNQALSPTPNFIAVSCTMHGYTLAKIHNFYYFTFITLSHAFHVVPKVKTYIWRNKNVRQLDKERFMDRVVKFKRESASPEGDFAFMERERRGLIRQRFMFWRMFCIPMSNRQF